MRVTSQNKKIFEIYILTLIESDGPFYVTYNQKMKISFTLQCIVW